jgi:hypothetical protein
MFLLQNGHSVKVNTDDTIESVDLYLEAYLFSTSILCEDSELTESYLDNM